MIKDLYEYALSHPEIVMPQGYAEASVDFIVCVSFDGHVVDISDARIDGKSAKFVRPVRNGARNDDPFVRKAEEFFDPASKKLQSLMVEFDACHDAAFDGVRELFSSHIDELLDGVSVKCRDVPKANVGFSVLDDNRVEAYVWDVPGVRDWWAGRYAEENRSSRECIDILTGQRCYASKLIKNTPVKAAGGGQTSGSNLVSFNAPAFESYGFGQGANMPAGMDSLSKAIDAYNHLALHGVRLAGMRLVCWCSGLDPEQEDMLNDVFRFDFGSFDKSATQDEIDAAGRRIKDILSMPVSGSGYGGLDNGTYHVLLTKADAARISVLYYDTGSCSDLLGNYRRWYEAMSVLDISGRSTLKQRNAYGLIYAAVPLRDRNAKDMFSKHRKFVKPVVQACMQGRRLPDDLLYMAVRAFKSAFYPHDDEKVNIAGFGGTVQLINLCLTIGKDGGMMSGDCKARSAAYLFGRLFAVHEWFYGVATKNSGVMTERFATCCQKPAAQIKKIQILCAHRMRDVHWYVGKKLFQSECEEIFGMLDDIPTGLDMKQQAEFILGYWHENGRITAELNKPAASGPENKEENNND